MLFADVRGSTTLAENLPSAEFSRKIYQIYKTATDVLLNTDALIDRRIGDKGRRKPVETYTLRVTPNH